MHSLFRNFITRVPPCSTLFWAPRRNAAVGGPIGANSSARTRTRTAVGGGERNVVAGHAHMPLLLLPRWATTTTWSGWPLGPLMFRAIGDLCGPLALHHARTGQPFFLAVGRGAATGPRAQGLFLPPGHNKSNLTAAETARGQFPSPSAIPISSLNLRPD